MNNSNRIQVKRKTKDIKESNIAFLLDLNKEIMNVNLKGQLQSDDNRPGGPTFIGVQGEFYPAMTLFGNNVQISVQSGLEVPLKAPSK